MYLKPIIVFTIAVLNVVEVADSNKYHTYTLWTSESKRVYNSVAEATARKSYLSKLLGAVKAANLAETLSSDGPFTLFAPRNAAFFKIPQNSLDNLLNDENALKKVLLRHVVPSKILAGDIPSGETDLTTAGGEKITVTLSKGGVTVKSSSGSGKVTKTDILAKNGVIHIIDSVI